MQKTRTLYDQHIFAPKDKFNNLSKEERDALYSLKNDNAIFVKGADNGSGTVVWDMEDYLKEALK